MLVSMTAFWVVIKELLNIIKSPGLVEIGGNQGELTQKLCDWAKPYQAYVHVIETQPPDALKQVMEQYPFARLHVGLSLEILPILEKATCFIIDGDHNYYTVYNELKLITQYHKPDLILLHDIGWPWGRRDLYYDVKTIPDDYRHDYITDPDLGIVPGNQGVLPQKGLRSNKGRFAFAKMEGGPRNGVLTAVQDFLSENPDYQLFSVDCVFGLGVLVPRNASYYAQIANALNRYVANPLITLLEQDRLHAFINIFNNSHDNNQKTLFPPTIPSNVQSARSAYIDLMKQTLLDLIYSKPDDFVKSANRQVITVKEARQTGLDWPERALTMIGRDRLDNIQFCVEDVLQRGIPGDFIETGVWRGGSCIFMRSILKAYEVTDRTVWVADSFEGLPKPDGDRYPLDKGLDLSGRSELAVSRSEVAAYFERFGLLDDQVMFLEGWFKDTLATAPIERLAVLRLDGDLYQSTMEALVSLYPKLMPGGYVIVDDYGAVGACRQAVTDYRRQHGITEEIHAIDWTGIYWRRTQSPIQRSSEKVQQSTRPLISVVIVIHNMERVAPQTLQSFTAAYQNIPPDSYEVIVVENGSDQPLSRQQVEAFGTNFRYFNFPESSPSPVGALNFGVKQARGQMIGLMIDGAHLVTPGVLKYALRALKAYTNPVVSILPLHLGPKLQRLAIQDGYSEQVEDGLLQQIDWPNDGYKLFTISSLIGAHNGWLLPMSESNCVFVLRSTYDELGGFDERFNASGGGLANLDFYYRLCEHLTTELIILVGEGSFHQIHGGVSTNNSDGHLFQNNLASWKEQYKAIRGKEWEPSTKRPECWGYPHQGALHYLSYSVQRLMESQTK